MYNTRLRLGGGGGRFCFEQKRIGERKVLAYLECIALAEQPVTASIDEKFS